MDREIKRLIDANAEKAKVDVIVNSLIFGDEDADMLEFMDTLKQLLRNSFDAAPTVDAVEVVRCKDCAYYNTNSCSDGCGWCEYLERGEFDEHFCNYADRKGGEQNAPD